MVNETLPEIRRTEMLTEEIKIDLSIQTLELSLPLVSSSLASPPAQDNLEELTDIFSKVENSSFTLEK